MEEFFPFPNPRLTAGLELARDAKPSLLGQDKTTQASLLHRGLQDTLPLGSFRAFLPTQASKLRQGEESPETAKLEKHLPLKAKRQMWINLILFLSLHPGPLGGIREGDGHPQDGDREMCYGWSLSPAVAFEGWQGWRWGGGVCRGRTVHSISYRAVMGQTDHTGLREVYPSSLQAAVSSSAANKEITSAFSASHHPLSSSQECVRATRLDVAVLAPHQILSTWGIIVY